MKVTGETVIWRNDVNGMTFYSRSISWHPYRDGQLDKGTWERAYETVKLPKGVDLPNKTKIMITDSFESGYMNRKGEPVRQLIVLDFDLVDGEQVDDSFEAIEEKLPF